MTECKVYSSLFALVDSHLSSISLQENQSDDSKKSIPIPSLKPDHNESASEAHISRNKQSIPNMSSSESPISQILANQVANMLLAKEKREREEKERLAKENVKIEKEDLVIDLMQALQNSSVKTSVPVQSESVSSSSSCECLFDIQFMDCDEELEPSVSPEPLLPCIMDMSYILDMKIPKSKCSTFGKVLSSKVKPVPGIYLHEDINSDIKVFKFDTPSPCDVIKSKLRKPTVSCSYSVNISDF